MKDFKKVDVCAETFLGVSSETEVSTYRTVGQSIGMSAGQYAIEDKGYFYNQNCINGYMELGLTPRLAQSNTKNLGFVRVDSEIFTDRS